MSRARPRDNSTSVSLFPFLAVLLCTMGALLVVLVAVSRSARDAALRQVAAHEEQAVGETDPAAREKLAQINKYVADLSQVRSEAERRIREEQLRLSHLEERMRRLQDQLQALHIAAAELDALEEEHYDDREQAEREVARLQQLIASTRDTISSLKDEANGKKRSYALVPYEGVNGTLRRPIYVECCKGELILQPEGVRISRDDLRPPLGPGNPLASALRAARDHVARHHPAEGQSRDSEPYPLIVVRPAGLTMYDRARRAIESADLEFGYELAEDDWELKYPPADPQLALVEQQAIDQARIRQQLLAAAAPRAYRHAALVASGGFDFDDVGSGGVAILEGSGAGDGGDGAGGGSLGTGGTGGASANEGTDEQSGAGSGSGGPNDTAQTSDSDESNRTQDGQAGNGEGGPELRGNSVGQVEGGANAGSATANAGSSGAAGGDSAHGSSTGGQMAGTSTMSGQDHQIGQEPIDLTATRGQDWALRRKNARAVPIQRTVQVVVRGDHIAVLSDEAQLRAARPAGKTIPLKGDTVEALDQVVGAVHEHIDSWGMAGNGMYWRPVLVLNVGPDGQRRAQDLARLLKNSGLDVRVPATATQTQQGQNRATR